MSIVKKVFGYTLLLWFLWSCETEVALELDEVPPFLIVDAWLTHTSDTQRIKLNYTRPYFDNGPRHEATGASVYVGEAETLQVFEFIDPDNDGIYEWIPSAGERFGQPGRQYGLQIELDGITYQSLSKMDSVPTIDSITFEYYPKSLFTTDEYYIGEFWARDLPGLGDSYWIKTWKNGQFLNQPEQINLAYDAGFSAGGELDSIIFIQPIRTAINPFDANDDGLALPPYTMGDSVYVEIHAISNEAWFFMLRVAQETNRPGGFAELFAAPPGNVPTNILSSDPNVRVAGFFSVAGVSALSVKVDEQTVRDRFPD